MLLKNEYKAQNKKEWITLILRLSVDDEQKAVVVAIDFEKKQFFMFYFLRISILEQRNYSVLYYVRILINFTNVQLYNCIKLSRLKVACVQPANDQEILIDDVLQENIHKYATNECSSLFPFKIWRLLISITHLLL